MNVLQTSASVYHVWQMEQRGLNQGLRLCLSKNRAQVSLRLGKNILSYDAWFLNFRWFIFVLVGYDTNHGNEKKRPCLWDRNPEQHP
jgi:hypothetical protein